MAEYPEAEFFKEFFRRTKHNLECIEQQNDAYSVTQLINSLFGMLIFPQQKYCKDIRIIDGKKEGAKWNSSWKSLKNKAEGDYDFRHMNYPNFIEHLRNAVAHPQGMEIVSEKGEIKSIKLVDKSPKTNKKFRLTIEVNELKDFAMEFCQVMISHLDSLKEM